MDEEKSSVWQEGKRVGGCCGPDYDDWMKDKNEYLNEVK